MLTIARLRPDGSERTYYERTVATSQEDYYAGAGEVAGEWVGAAAERLGLSGTLTDGDLTRLLQGLDPVTGKELRPPPPARDLPRTRIDPATGERITELVTHRPVAGFDLTFSAPKSVSLLYALAGAGVQGVIAGAHRAAWHDAMALLEEEACVVRSGTNGVVRVRSGFAAAGFMHRTNRDGDPHLHTHVVVANMAPSGDGKWRALDGQLFVRDWRHAAGHVYQARLRHELTARLGVEWGPVTNGQADLAAVPATVIQEFSQRRQVVLDHAAANGGSGFAARERAQVITRPDKGRIDWPEAVGRWRARAAEHGLDTRALDAVRARPRAPRTPDARVLLDDLLGADGLTAKRQTFTHADAVVAIADAHPEGATVSAIRAAARDAFDAPHVVPVGDARLGRPARATTREVLAREAEGLAVAVRGRAVHVASTTDTRVDAAVRAQDVRLTEEQTRVAHVVGAHLDRVACVVGRAGAGKTTAIAAGARALEADGIAVLGAAPSAQAARTLAESAGIEARTMHALLVDATRAPIPTGCVLVVDEASMADTRTLSALLAHVEERDARAVLVGDPAQLPAVGPGGLFAALCEREGAVRLEGNRRQREGWERTALAQIRSGDVEPAIIEYAARGRVAACDDPADARACLIADWWDAMQRVGPQEAVMLAHRRTDVRALNDAARQLLTDAGALDGPRVRAGGRDYAVGDRVVARRNDRGLAVRNGTRGVITDLNADGGIILTADGGERIELPSDYVARSVDHAYALTVHAAQGATVTEAFVLASDASRLAEWGYVALSRARERTRLYVVDTSDARDLGALEPAAAGPSIDTFADSLGRPVSEPLALDQHNQRQDPSLADALEL